MRKQIKTEHTGNLPHFHRVGATFFITTHLHNSIPFDALKKLREKRDKSIEALKKKQPSSLERYIHDSESLFLCL